MSVISNDTQKRDVALAALYEVLDPEIGLNIVDLGLVYQIDFDETEKKVYATMTLTTQFCPMGESITDGTHQALQAAFPDYEIIINLTFDPAWNNSMISDAGREYLNQ